MARRLVVCVFVAGLLAIGISASSTAAVLEGDGPPRGAVTAGLVAPTERPVTRVATDNLAAFWALLVVVVAGVLSISVRPLTPQRAVLTQVSRGSPRATRAPPTTT